MLKLSYMENTLYVFVKFLIFKNLFCIF